MLRSMEVSLSFPAMVNTLRSCPLLSLALRSLSRLFSASALSGLVSLRSGKVTRLGGPRISMAHVTPLFSVPLKPLVISPLLILPEADVELGNSQASVTAPERGPIVSSASWTPSTHTMETSSEQKDHHVLPKGQTVSRLSDESLGSQQTLNDERTSIAQPAPINTDVTLSSTMLYSPSGARPVIDEHDGQDLSHDPKLPDMEK